MCAWQSTTKHNKHKTIKKSKASKRKRVINRKSLIEDDVHSQRHGILLLNTKGKKTLSMLWYKGRTEGAGKTVRAYYCLLQCLQIRMMAYGSNRSIILFYQTGSNDIILPNNYSCKSSGKLIALSGQSVWRKFICDRNHSEDNNLGAEYLRKLPKHK